MILDLLGNYGKKPWKEVKLNIVIIPAQKKKLFGFTLIELLIVIAILGILAAAVLVAVNPAKRQRQARDSARKSDIGQIATALQAYFTTPGQGLYPTSLGVLTSSGDLKLIPTDPTGGPYDYTYDGSTAEAWIWDVLEDPTGASGSVWCWASTSGRAAEATSATDCTT